MKHIKYIILSVSLFFLSSCLDVEPENFYGETEIWSSITNLDVNVKSFYGNVLNHVSVNELMTASNFSEFSDGYSDLVKFTRYNNGAFFNRFFAEVNYMTEANAGSFSPWSDMYDRIRQANEFLIHINNGKGEGMDPEELDIRIGEIRFFRAFAYQELVKRHGGVILRIDETKLDGPEETNKARSSEEECWNFIIGEYEKAAELLPDAWSTENYGRLTKGSAWGMTARAALYAKRWDKAIEAGEKVVNSDLYQLVNDYATLWTWNFNPEVLIGVYYNASHSIMNNYDPYFAPSGDVTTAGGMASPTDEFASQFDIYVNGSWIPFDWDYVIENGIDPWANRDPRFYQTILYNGANWKDRQLELYVGGKDGFLQYAETGLDGERGSVTGYAARKWLKNEEMNMGTERSDIAWIELRLTEVYLILSEAYARSGDFVNAYKYLNMPRARSSVNMPALQQKSNWNDYFQDLQKERICELGLEGHRFWDLRRWGIAREVLAGSRTHGVKITKLGEGSYKYERVESDVRDRLFPERYTIVPIPLAEMQRNSLCVQDELWR